MMIVSFVLKIWLGFCKLRHILGFIYAGQFVTWVKCHLCQKKKTESNHKNKIDYFRNEQRKLSGSKSQNQNGFTMTFIHMTHDQVTSLEGKLLVAYTTTGFTFFVKSEPNRVDWHNELCPKTGNLRLFSVWKMLVWDLDTTHGQHWLCELECVGISKWLRWRTWPHSHQPCQQWWNGSTLAICQVKKPACEQFQASRMSTTCMSLLFWASRVWACHCQTLVRLFKWRPCWCYSTITSTFLVTHWEWCFWVTWSFSTQSAKTKWWNELLNLAFFKTRWKCKSNLLCFCCLTIELWTHPTSSWTHPTSSWTLLKNVLWMLNWNKTAKQQRTRHKVEWLLICLWEKTTYSLRALCKQNKIHSNFNFLWKEAKMNHIRNLFYVKPFCSLCLCFCFFFFVRIQLTMTRTASREPLLAKQNASSVKGQKIKTVTVFVFASLIIKTLPVRVWAWPFGEQFVEWRKDCLLVAKRNISHTTQKRRCEKCQCLPLLLNSVQAAIELLWVW